MNTYKVAQVHRPAGSYAIQGRSCAKCGCRAQNLVTLTDGRTGYACRWNNHVTYVHPGQ